MLLEPTPCSLNPHHVPCCAVHNSRHQHPRYHACQERWTQNLLVNSEQHIRALFNNVSRVPLTGPAVGLQPVCAMWTPSSSQHDCLMAMLGYARRLPSTTSNIPDNK